MDRGESGPTDQATFYYSYTLASTLDLEFVYIESFLIRQLHIHPPNIKTHHITTKKKIRDFIKFCKGKEKKREIILVQQYIQLRERKGR